jgi:hypothetical protein
MASKRTSIDPDSTLRALEGFDSPRISGQPEQEEHNSDDSDLFLRAAREEEMAQRASNPNSDRLIRSDKRRVRDHLITVDGHYLQSSLHFPFLPAGVSLA